MLVAEAIAGIFSGIVIADTGDTTADLLALMRATATMYGDPATAPLLSAFVAAMARSDVVAEAIRGGFVARWRESVRVVLKRSVARGEVRRGTRLDDMIDVLSGPLFYRYLMMGAPIDDRFVRVVVAAAMAGFAPAGS